MARNRKFKRKYTIEFEGITTNDFAIQVLDDLFEGIAKAAGEQHKQIKLVNFKAEGTKYERKTTKNV